MDTVRVVFIAAGAIVAAIIIWWIIAIVTSVLFTIIKFAFLVAVVYVLFLIARSSVRKRSVQNRTDHTAQ